LNVSRKLLPPPVDLEIVHRPEELRDRLHRARAEARGHRMTVDVRVLDHEVAAGRHERRVELELPEHVETTDLLRRGSTELSGLVGDPAKLRTRVGWQPSMDARQVIEAMVNHDMRLIASMHQATG
jgi:GDP-D-mannose dehydratase